MSSPIRYFLTIITVILFAACKEKLYSLSTTSPENIYKVQLKEKITEYSKENPHLKKVFLQLKKNENIIVGDEELYSFDSEDDHFGQKISETKWISNNILQLSNFLDHHNEFPTDIIEISNDTGKTLTYTLIDWSAGSAPHQQFLIVDMLPDKKYKIKVLTNVNQNNVWIACYSKLNDGRPIDKFFGNFYTNGKNHSPINYNINITEDRKIQVEENPKL